MAVPLVEIDLNGTWTDISTYVLYNSGSSIEITHGQQNESTSLDASTLTATLKNGDGRFSLGNPTGAYYGVLGRNNRIRCGVLYPLGHAYLWLQDDEDTKDSYAWCPDSAATSITGDIDVRIELLGKDWHVGGNTQQDLCGKYAIDGDQRSWAFCFGSGTGQLVLFWSPDGTLASRKTAVSTVGVDLDAGVAAFRVTLDVDNGAGGWTARFYIADSIGGTWTQLGADVTGSGTTSIFNSTASTIIGNVFGLSGGPIAGYYHRFELRNGINGTVVANPDFTAQTRGTTSFTDTASSPNTWTVAVDGFIETYLWRFNGEISSLTPTRDISGKFTTVALQASGITRRLTQGEVPARSSMYRAHTNPNVTSIRAYWPMEDGTGASEIASGLPDGLPMTIDGTPSLAAYSNWTASDAVPQAVGTFTGRVPAYAVTGEAMIYMFVYVSGAVTAETSLMWVETTGTARYWDLRLLANGNMRVKAYDSTQTAIDDGSGDLDAEVAYGINSRGFLIAKLQLAQSGSNINWASSINDFAAGDTIDASGLSSNTLEDSGTLTSYTFGRIRSVTINRDGKASTGTIYIGHLAVTDEIDTWLNDVAKGIVAWNGEVPSDRIYRLAVEEDLPLVHVSSGLAGDSVTMGDQFSETIASLLQACADSDGGTLYEPREMFGLAYRTRISQYARKPVLQLDHAAHELAGPLTPVYDDQRTRNDITVERVNGSRARAQQTDGPLSIQDPPDGVGHYNTSVSLVLTDDSGLDNQAAWRLHMGTADEPRYASLPVQLYSNEFDDTLRTMALVTDVGDRVVVKNPPADMDPNTVDQIVIGYNEQLDQFLHSINYVTIPGRPWDVGVVGDAEQARVDTGGADLASGITADGSSSQVGFVGVASTLNATATDNVVVNKPAGVAAGHLMIARIGLIGQVTITAPSGWIQVGPPQDAGGATRYAAYYKVAGSSEPTSYTWTWTGNNFKNSGVISAYSSVDTSSPILDSIPMGTNVAGTSFNTGSVTAVDGAMLDVGAFERHTATGSATTWTNGSDTERVDHGSASGSGQDMSHAVYSSTALSAGAVSRTLTASQAVQQVATWAILLRPSADSTLSVTTTGTARWIDSATYPGEFPFDIDCGGEQMTVTAISGTSSPQSFTVIRSVNGVVKAHDAGTPVSLYKKTYAGL